MAGSGLKHVVLRSARLPEALGAHEAMPLPPEAVWTLVADHLGSLSALDRNLTPRERPPGTSPMRGESDLPVNKSI